jgi:two-component system response regulator DesR
MTMPTATRPTVAGKSRRGVLVIDDQRLFTDVLTVALDAQPDLHCVAAAGTVRDGLVKAHACDFDVAIVDLHLPDGGGLNVVASLRALRPSAQLVVLTSHARPGLLAAARRAGADALLVKDQPLRTVLDVIRGADQPRPHVTAPAEVPRLTPREREVLELLASGTQAQQIARELGLSLHTVRDHIRAILGKLGAHSQLDAVVTADRLGLIGHHERCCGNR